MEREFISWLRKRLPPHPLVRLGLGDDAAVLRMAGLDECVITVDMLTDHVDFELAEIDPRRVGRKCLAANLSDLAAMAAKPLAGVVALALPRQGDCPNFRTSENGTVPLRIGERISGGLSQFSFDENGTVPFGKATVIDSPVLSTKIETGDRQGAMELAVALYEGMLPLAERYDLAIAGGDTNCWDGPLAVSITLLGAVTARGPLRRDGAKPGDRILATGSFGGSILGRHLDFEPRVREALELHARYELHAGIDTSDGLSLDLAHILEASGCGAMIDTGAVPLADDASRLAERLADGSTPLDHALSDGEDFELILAVPVEEAKRIVAEQPVAVPIADIGEFVAEPGLWQIDRSGVRRPLLPRGWEHG